MTRMLVAAGVLALAAVAPPVLAQDYPTRPIRLISPFPPGGFNDILSRLIGQKLTASWGQQVVVDNRPGANMIVGTSIVAKAAPDGYTLVMSAIPHAINPSLYKLPYDPVADFTPVVMITSVPSLLAVHPSLPAKTVQELIAYARANPGKLTFASVGSGSSFHLAGELFKTATGVDMLHVPYKGAAPALTALVAGRVLVYFGNMASTLPQVRAGRLRGIAVTSLQRSPATPELPTVAESGVPGFEVSSWYGLLGPARLPAPLAERISAEVSRIVKMPDVSKRLERDGAQPLGSTPEAFAARIRGDIEKWAKVVKASGAKVD